MPLTITRMATAAKVPLLCFVCLIVLLMSDPASALELSFSPSTISGTGSSPLAVVAADFNNDGIADLAVLSSSSVIRMNGNGDGTFQTGSTIYSGSGLVGITVGNFNNDTLPDLALVSQFSQLIILRNSGSSFDTENLFIDSIGVTSIAAGDFDNDGWIDLALLTNNGITISQFFNFNNTFASSPD